MLANLCGAEVMAVQPTTARTAAIIAAIKTECRHPHIVMIN